MRSFQFLAVTLSGLIDPSLAIAASRAGGLGVLNLDQAQDLSLANHAIQKLTRFATSACGLKFDSRHLSLFEQLTVELPPSIGTIILSPLLPIHANDTAVILRALSPQIDALRSRGVKILWEVTSLAEAQLVLPLGIDGLIAKGHEAGGWVGEETVFILLQQLLTKTQLPVWAYGGIGLHTVAACYAAGAAGVVLDSQLMLTRESTLPAAAKKAIATMDGSETVCLGTTLGQAFRVYSRSATTVIQTLNEREMAQVQAQKAQTDVGHAAESVWWQTVKEKVGWTSLADQIWPVGQDACFAKGLADRYGTVGGVIEAMRQSIRTYPQRAAVLRSLDADAPLAQSHGTRYPIVQGPMTRVSDRAEFAFHVAQGGGLPFLALALMRAPEVDTLLAQTKDMLGERPWGVGILGFVPLELRQEQLAVIRKYAPPFALIAGGRPDQARALEADGIPAYLHVPSPGLLRLFLQDGARRFVFEGRECGGHVGPRSSFVLWNSMIDVLLQELPLNASAACHVLFAGGIHDQLSAAMVATMAAPLAERGVKIGVLMGTAYLFTQEAVQGGAIVESFQEEALRCQETVLLESGPGHATRCAPSPFVDRFFEEKQRLQAEGKSSEEIRMALEELNIGRLRIASKGITRQERSTGSSDKFAAIDGESQRQQGMYMIGQVAALHEQICTLEELHKAVTLGSTAYLQEVVAPSTEVPESIESQPSAIAIVGISTLLPKAQTVQEFWANVVNKVSAIGEIPRDRWDASLYFDADRTATDKVYSKVGGFLEDVPFDPLDFGIPPNSLASIDPVQLLALVAARAALNDAGYQQRTFDRQNTSVILGASGGTGDLGAAYLLRAGLPLLFGQQGFELAQQAGDVLPEWTEDSFPGLLLNVAAGRIANRMDFGGSNFVVDAACASSLAAVHLAVKELETHGTNLVLVGGIDTTQNPFAYLSFSKTQALSPTGQPRVFDASGDGIVISEGVVMLVLKRLPDAERDGDRIYAVIRGVAGSSDGRALGLTAPRAEGQALALERAYARAGFSPTTVALFEAHGTGTVVGDRTEARALSAFLSQHGAQPQNHAIGSVKSMIGHTKASAGVASVGKMALALYHKVLPPTLGVTQPNPKAGFGEGPLYVNSEARPWLQSIDKQPRRAGVSAFGFGGTNFHAVLEEYTGDFLADQREKPLQRWPSELLLWSAPDRQALLGALQALENQLVRGASPSLRDLAFTLAQQFQTSANPAVSGAPTPLMRLAIVAESLADLGEKLAITCTLLRTEPKPQLQDPKGIYFAETGLAATGKLAFLFPGQGSQQVNMVRDLAMHFDQVRAVFEAVDQVLAQQFAKPLSRYIFPPPTFTPEEARQQQTELTETHVAQPALGAASMALVQLLQSFGIQADMVAGHSYGEYAALCAAGVIDLPTLALISAARGRAIVESAQGDLGTMAAVWADAQTTKQAIQGSPEVWLANLNAPNQTIISGTKAGVASAVAKLQASGINAKAIPVSCAFHSPLMQPAQQRLASALAHADFAPPQLPVFSNTTATDYPTQPEQIRALLTEHLLQPVRFTEEIAAMYQAGARIFVEVGPGSVLTNLTGQILREPHLAVVLDSAKRNGLTQLHHTLGQLAVQGVPLHLDPLFAGRATRSLNLSALVAETQPAAFSATTYWVNGSRVRPLNVPKQDARIPDLQLAPATTPTPPVLAQPTAPFAALPLPEARRNGHVNNLNGASQPTATPPPAAQPPIMPSSAAQPVVQASSDREAVMLHFQQTMTNFLATERNVMLTYLQGSAGTAIAAPNQLPPVSATVPATPVTTVNGTHNGHLAEPAQEIHQGAPRQLDPVSPAPAVNGHHPQSAPLVVEATSPVEPAPVASGYSREQVTTDFLQIISDRTGYPAEMLDLDVDIEANLGIDSIKRVEILGTFQRTSLAGSQAIQQSMEQLTSLKTLRGIIDWLDQHLNPAQAESENREDTRVATTLPVPMGNGLIDAPHTAHDEIPRTTLAVVDAPSLRGTSLQVDSTAVLVITDDGRGVAHALAERIHHYGGRAAIIAMPETPDTAAKVVQHLRQEQGPIGGIVHLLPLRNEDELLSPTLTTWRDRLQQTVKGLFYLVQAAAEDLKQAARTGAGRILAIESDFVGDGALTGLLKTIALEWPELPCKSVRIEHQPDPADGRPISSALVELIVAELAANDELVEILYQGGQRKALQFVTSPLSTDARPVLAIERDWVIALTGGARGITAEVAIHLAQQYQPTLVLLGSSPLPAAQESPTTAGLTTAQQIKEALIEALRQTGQPIALARVEEEYRTLLKAREIRTTLAHIRQAGAQVAYHQVDVRDETAMRAILDGIYQTYGRLDGVIHGAGIIEDKRIEQKTADSFDRVFDTKVDSAFLLTRLLRPESLKFFALFASVSGTFGNRGQSDYAAANSLLNRLALDLDQRWAARVVALNWGPWLTGMVSDALQQEFTRRQIKLISIAEGCRIFDRELRHGQKGEPVVVLVGGQWTVPPATVRTQAPQQSPAIPTTTRNHATKGSLPLLTNSPVIAVGDDHFEAMRTLDVAVDRYLQDHQLDGKPVFPFAMAMELMTEVAEQSWPTLHVIAVREQQVLRGVVLENGPKCVRVIALGERVRNGSGMVAKLKIVDAESGQLHFQATLDLADQWPVAPYFAAPAIETLQPFTLPINEAYQRWLFHGPLFQGIKRVEGISSRWLVGTLAASSPHLCLATANTGHWLIDPIVFDSALQLIILWTRTYLDATPLPSRFRSYQRFAPALQGTVRCYLEFPEQVQRGIFSVNIAFVGEDGRLLGLLQEMETPYSKALNRLANKDLVTG